MAQPISLEDLKAFRVSKAGHVAEVLLAGPGKGNAMGPDFWRECPRVFDALGKDDEVRAVVVRGSGAHFSYGLDLVGMGGSFAHLMGTPGAAERRELLGWIGELQRAFGAIAACPKPVVAAVHGWCIGGGLDMIAACDVRLCSKDARFSLREVKVGMVADLGSLQRLPPIIGEGATRELAFTGKDIGAERAERLGLVSEVFEGEEALAKGALALAEEMAKNSPLVVRGIKAIMNDALEPRVQAGLRAVALWNTAFLPSEDLGEAVSAFMQKRPPSFKGR